MSHPFGVIKWISLIKPANNVKWEQLTTMLPDSANKIFLLYGFVRWMSLLVLHCLCRQDKVIQQYINIIVTFHIQNYYNIKDGWSHCEVTHWFCKAVLSWIFCTSQQIMFTCRSSLATPVGESEVSFIYSCQSKWPVSCSSVLMRED